MTSDLDKLSRVARRRRLFLPSETTVTTALERSAIEKMIPHRPPFLLVDRIDAVDLSAKAIQGQRWIDPQDPILAGHFPGDPVYPGALLLEAIGQINLCLLHLLAHQRTEILATDQPQPLRLVKVHQATFLHEVRPSTRIDLIGVEVERNAYTLICGGQVLQGDTICAVAFLEVYFFGDETKDSHSV